MMLPIRDWMAADATADGIFRQGGLLRVFQDEVPQDTERANKSDPVLIYTLITGTPLHSFDCTPKTDYLRIQFDVYASDQYRAESAFTAARNVIERHGYVFYNFTERDTDTREWRQSFDATFWHTR